MDRVPNKPSFSSGRSNCVSEPFPRGPCLIPGQVPLQTGRKLLPLPGEAASLWPVFISCSSDSETELMRVGWQPAAWPSAAAQQRHQLTVGTRYCCPPPQVRPPSASSCQAGWPDSNRWSVQVQSSLSCYWFPALSGSLFLLLRGLGYE